jgi:precorrin-2 dehydrogenase/sirohydrochlorin ferrochelatase
VRAIVIGGGTVAVRKVRALRDAGASVRVVARDFSDDMTALVEADPAVALTRAEYSGDALRDGNIVIAATNDARVNRAVAADAERAGLLVNVVDAPDAGDFVTPAVHRAGRLVIAVATGGLPAAAARIRDEIGRRFDGRYATVIDQLHAARKRALASAGDAPVDIPIDGDFCARVEDGSPASGGDAWR